MSCPQIWNIQKEKGRKKANKQSSTKKERQIARASDKKTKERNFVGRTTIKFYTGGKLEILAASKMKISGSRNRLAGGTGKISEKEFKQQLSTYDTSSFRISTRNCIDSRPNLYLLRSSSSVSSSRSISRCWNFLSLRKICKILQSNLH